MHFISGNVALYFLFGISTTVMIGLFGLAYYISKVEKRTDYYEIDYLEETPRKPITQTERRLIELYGYVLNAAMFFLGVALLTGTFVILIHL